MIETLTKEELINRFSQLYNLSIAEAAEVIGEGTEEEQLKRIEDYIVKQINSKSNIKLNREQRRKLAKKSGHKFNKEEVGAISDTTKKLGYINLIEGLRKLNKEQENNGKCITENN